MLAVQHLGAPVGRSKYEIEAARCTKSYTDLLGMEADEPVLIRHVDVYTSSGSSLWTGESIYRADLYKYRVEIVPGQNGPHLTEMPRGVDRAERE